MAELWTQPKPKSKGSDFQSKQVLYQNHCGLVPRKLLVILKSGMNSGPTSATVSLGAGFMTYTPGVKLELEVILYPASSYVDKQTDLQKNLFFFKSVHAPSYFMSHFVTVLVHCYASRAISNATSVNPYIASTNHTCTSEQEGQQSTQRVVKGGRVELWAPLGEGPAY